MKTKCWEKFRKNLEDLGADRIFLKLIPKIKNKISTELYRGCWNWMGIVTDSTPLIRIGVKRVRVRKLILNQLGFLIFNEVVKVICGNPKCVNPLHFRVPHYSLICYRGHALTAPGEICEICRRQAYEESKREPERVNS